MPSPSLPITRPSAPSSFASAIGVPPMSAPAIQSPSSFRRAIAPERFATRATLQYSTAPAEALQAAAVTDTARRLGRITPCAPAHTALRMMEETGCDGVVIGRGCLGRPWLFGDLAAAFKGDESRERPNLGEVGQMIIRHAELLTGIMGERGIVDLRKHMAWYFKGYPVGELRRRFAMVSSLEELRELVELLDHDAEFPTETLGTPRGRQGTPRSKVAVPHGWYDDTSGTSLDLSEAELDTSGG